MKRAIVVPAILAGAALEDLKQWLAIGTSAEDALLTGLLRAALELCEAFTGQIPLEASCEETLPATSGWQPLQTRPVQAVTGVEEVMPDGSRQPFAANGYLVDIDADGGGRVRLIGSAIATRIAVRFTAGLAAEWADLPDSLRRGVLHLAMHQYRERDAGAGLPVPPAAVAALWRPWRRMRLA